MYILSLLSFEPDPVVRSMLRYWRILLLENRVTTIFHSNVLSFSMLAREKISVSAVKKRKRIKAKHANNKNNILATK